MRKKGFVLLFILVIAAFSQGKAQNYNWAIGVRGGVTASGITVRHNFDPSNSIEAIIDFAQGFNLYALYERNIPVIEEGFNFYYGAGANIGAWDHHHSEFAFGIDGVIGLEYKLPTIPLAFSLDYKPNLNLIEKTKFHALDFGLGVKVTF